jgi:beta-lactamase superfamily II metal-dependent hydrolase
MRTILLGLMAVSLTLSARDLDVYFVDVEGGQATLIVSPSGESMLVDAGWPGFGGRDADRIVAAAKLAGVKQIDYLVISHYHTDHVGGVPELAAKIPIVHFVDHGASFESGKNPDALFAAYKAARDKGKHIEVKAGDRIPIKGLDVTVVAASGNKVAAPLKGAGAENPLCASFKPRNEDKSENGRSVGVLIVRKNFRMIDLGDLTWNKEQELVCPANLIGNVDVYLTTHHGMNMSGPDTIVHALKPRVAIMNNGAKKGGTPEAWKVVKSSPGLEDLWQVHYAVAGGKETNVDEQMIANVDENCQGHWLKLSAKDNGQITVTNGRNQYSKTYKPLKR